MQPRAQEKPRTWTTGPRYLLPRRAVASPGNPQQTTHHERFLDVVIQRELVRMRTLPHGLDLVLDLVINPSFEQLLAENIAFE